MWSYQQMLYLEKVRQLANFSISTFLDCYSASLIFESVAILVQQAD